MTYEDEQKIFKLRLRVGDGLCFVNEPIAGAFADGLTYEQLGSCGSLALTNHLREMGAVRPHEFREKLLEFSSDLDNEKQIMLWENLKKFVYDNEIAKQFDWHLMKLSDFHIEEFVECIAECGGGVLFYIYPEDIIGHIIHLKIDDSGNILNNGNPISLSVLIRIAFTDSRNLFTFTTRKQNL